MMVDITAMMMRTEGPEPGTLDFGSAQHSARKGKNRLYVCHKVYPARIILENSMMSIMSELDCSEIGQLFSNTGFH